MLEKKLEEAIKKRIKEVGSEPKLSKASGVTQSRINNLKNGLHKHAVNINTIKFGTLRKLFPHMQIDFFGTGNQHDHIGKIVKMLNRLSGDEQLDIMLSIASKYKHAL